MVIGSSGRSSSPTSPRRMGRPPDTQPLHTAVLSGLDGGNLETRQRFGIAGSALLERGSRNRHLSSGAVNSAMKSFRRIGGAVPFPTLTPVRSSSAPACTRFLLSSCWRASSVGGSSSGAPPSTSARRCDEAGLSQDPDHAADGALAHRAGNGPAKPGGIRPGDRARPTAFCRRLLSRYGARADDDGSSLAGAPLVHAAAAGNVGSHGSRSPMSLGGFDMLFARFTRPGGLFALAAPGALARQARQPSGPGHDVRTDDADVRRAPDARSIMYWSAPSPFFPPCCCGPIIGALTEAPLY